MSSFSEKVFLDQKLNNWIGYALFLSIAVVFGFLMATNFFVGMGLTVAVLGLAIIVVCLLSAEAGLYINLIYSFFISYFNRLFFDGDLQVGIFSDVLIAVTFLGFLIRRVGLKANINEFAKNKLVIALLVVYGYMAIELFNPNAAFFTGWFPAFRKILGSLLVLFISYNVFGSISRIKRYIVILFILTTIVAVYGCIQQWHGFFQFEENWLRYDPKRFRMTFIGGESRKMSTMNDAVSFAIIMATSSVFFLAIGAVQKRIAYKIVILGGVVLMLLGMSYSITRTANGMLMAGLFMFGILTFDKQITRIICSLLFVIFLFLLYAPIQNAQVDQFRQTFEAGNDASFNVREVNRKMIQPYIYRHPIGGGMGTTGGEGLELNAGHPLAGFPPDSGYLKKALEMGWIGFGLICVLYFQILKTGIHGYFTCKNEKIKFVFAGCTASIFSFYIGDFTQVAIGQITDIVVYYPFIAIMLKLRNIDKNTLISQTSINPGKINSF
jgi:putative inorganic carbon (hco3(-)) transporter